MEVKEDPNKDRDLELEERKLMAEEDEELRITEANNDSWVERRDDLLAHCKDE